ncbi:sugar ABC transporter permease, partial [Romboutsia ilealis]|nr:sugar ABC transporter permease [Romboutsia ilealis]
GGPAHQTETILSLMFSKFSDGNYGYASAFGMVFLLVSMLVAAVMLGVFKKWEDRLG